MSETLQPYDPFIPSWLDEAGLTANQFRVLAHIWRREQTFSTAATIAKTCRMKRNTVFDVLSDLEKAGFIRRQSRQGQTTLIGPVPFGDTGERVNPSPLGIREVSPLGIREVSPLGIHKGNPIKGIPLRVSKEKMPEENLPFQSEAFTEAWVEWTQHRREKKKPITPTSAKKQLKALLAMGEERAISAINHSIEKGWQGIFEPTQATGPNHTKKRELTSNDVGI